MALVGAAAMLAAAALFPAAAHGAAPLRPASIDLNAPVQSLTGCMPCHADLAGSNTPGLIFSHGSHMTLSCDACHRFPAHTGGVSIAPEMSTCFNCHGLRHGDQEVALSACPTCHTRPRSQLVPADHRADWAAKPHADASRADSNPCMMCHTAESCDACHARTAPGAAKTQPAYRPVLKGKPRQPVVRVMPNAPVTMSQCVNCHPDIDRFMPGRVIFAHATHLQRSFACKDCHRAFAHGPNTTTRPDMPSCYQCHGLTHASLGLVATDKCAACHPQGFVLRPIDHTADFVAHTHKAAANKSSQQCAMCHASSFCGDCHQGKPATPGGPPRRRVIPADHRLGTFKTTHGKNYLAQRGACGSCHESASCERCHSTPMPHPVDWTTTHALSKGLDSTECNVCHTDRKQCQDCHHNGMRGRDLVAKNCVRCHPVMATRPPTAIKDKGFAEHAVHFNAKTKQGHPYRCEDCHVGFGMSAVVAHDTGAQLSQGHDLRLCYECHGALDVDSVQIAPYPGKSLCLRCHDI